MAVGRTILVLIFAVSVAVTNGTITAAKSSPIAIADAGPATDAPCHGCCHHRNDFNAAACMLKCVVSAGAVIPVLAVVPTARIDRIDFSASVATMQGHHRRPPTRPPPL
jgi:hypothetical protein